jgi:hypothetical protein
VVDVTNGPDVGVRLVPFELFLGHFIRSLVLVLLKTRPEFGPRRGY